MHVSGSKHTVESPEVITEEKHFSLEAPPPGVSVEVSGGEGQKPGSLLDEILPGLSISPPTVVTQHTRESSTSDEGATRVIERTVREGEESSADDAGVRQRVSTTQTVTTEKTESEDENKKRTVEITRERVVVQRKVTRSEKILQVSAVLILE